MDTRSNHGWEDLEGVYTTLSRLLLISAPQNGDRQREVAF